MSTTTKNSLPAVALLLSDARGVYIPRDFVEGFKMELWQGVSEENIAILKAGPDLGTNQNYWDAWDTVTNNATFTENGHVWRLSQDGDLWALCDELMTREEKKNMGFDLDDEPEESEDE